MKPSDLVRINAPASKVGVSSHMSRYHDMIGLIIEEWKCDAWDPPMWKVLIDSDVVVIADSKLEVLDGCG